MKKSVVILIGIIITLIVVGVIANKWFSKQTIRNINITGNSALSNGDITSIIDNQIININTDGLNLNKIKETLLANEYIANADVFVNSKGVLGINIEERIPIAIIVNSNGTPMFIDRAAKIFSYKLHKEYTNLPIIRNIDTKNINKMKECVDIILTTKDKFPILYERISEVIYSPNKTKFNLNIADISVNIGNKENLEHKLNNINSFIDNVALKANNIKKYKHLDARWKDKIIRVEE
jgi:cell division septal protein FtsQ